MNKSQDELTQTVHIGIELEEDRPVRPHHSPVEKTYLDILTPRSKLLYKSLPAAPLSKNACYREGGDVNTICIARAWTGN